MLCAEVAQVNKRRASADFDQSFLYGILDLDDAHHMWGIIFSHFGDYILQSDEEISSGDGRLQCATHAMTDCVRFDCTFLAPAGIRAHLTGNGAVADRET